MSPEQNPIAQCCPIPGAAKEPAYCDGAQRLLGTIGDTLYVGGAILSWCLDDERSSPRPCLDSIDWTASSRLLLGLKHDGPLTPRRALRLVTRKERPALVRAIRESARSHRSFRQTIHLTDSRGKQAWVEVSCTVEPEFDAGSTMTLVFQNVSQSRLREAALRREILRRDQMARMAGIGTWSVEIASGELTWSDEVFNIHEMEPGSTPSVGEAIAFYTPEDASVVEERLERLLRDGIPYEIVNRIITAKGNRRWVHALAELELDPDGEPLRIIGSFRDITEQHEAETRLRESEERYMYALEGARDGLWDWVIPTSELHLSPRWKEIIGYADHEIGNHFDEWASRVPEDQREQALKAFEACVSGVTPDYRAEFQMRHKDGSYRWILARGKIMARDAHHQPLRVVGTHTDITEEVEMRNALVAAKEAAEQATTAKSEFLATMSHEIRTPLNGILGLTQVLMGTELGREQANYLNVILGSGTALLEILNDILDLSRTEAGKLVLEDVPFRPAECARSTIELLKHAATKKKNLELQLRVDDDVPEEIMGDPARLRQVLLNLVGNAVKFTESGFVRVTLSTLVGEGDRRDLMISVRDTGIGVTQKDATRLFEAFTQADSTTTRRFGGTGLGLSISRNLVHLMGGVIGCRPHLQGGSVFWVEIPIVEPAAGSAPAATIPELRSSSTAPQRALMAAPRMESIEGPKQPAADPAGDGPSIRALVVEDNPINQIVARRMLEKLGCHVVMVADGQRAVDTTAQEAFDIVFMDCQMPVMDGYESTRLIREREARLGLPRLPIVAMTANAMASDREACRGAGMDDYVSKPVLLDVLRAVIERVVAPSKAA
ncbi:PAS domain-containing protein [Saltatorellus ferox]